MSVNIIGYVCLGVCWGSSTLIGCYKGCVYCKSEEYKKDKANSYSYTYTTQVPDSGYLYGTKNKYEERVGHVNPALNNWCFKSFCWTIGGPISICCFSKEMYDKYKEKKVKAVTSQPSSARNESEKH